MCITGSTHTGHATSVVLFCSQLSRGTGSQSSTATNRRRSCQRDGPSMEKTLCNVNSTPTTSKTWHKVSQGQDLEEMRNRTTPGAQAQGPSPKVFLPKW